MHRFGRISLFSAVVLFAATCAAAPVAYGRSSLGTQGWVYYGPAKTVGNGFARSWVRTDRNGTPTSVGINISASALRNLPSTDSEFVLPLPQQVSVPPYNHATVDWNPHGHIPQGVYTVPHFDFHFYTISPRDRSRITLMGDDMAVATRTPASAYIPNGYMTAPGAAMPHMGNHWLPSNAPELHGGRFTSTFIYGFYNGRMAFVEPMMTLAFLRSKPNLVQDIAQPGSFQQSGYYPTRYSVRYDPKHDWYNIALGGFALR